uniref:Late embryogenesis abundant protein LEA-2 subgroup domain-containing protein n=1 Tax=Oryza punctata TaxID=4537 RepID=A0A0E0KM71_ORYPU
MAGGPGSCEMCTSCCTLVVLLAAAVLILTYGVVDNVGVTVEDASLTRLDLAGANGTDLAYGISLTVAVYNPNMAVRAEYTQPLAAELRLATGELLRAVHLADAGQRVEATETDRFRVTDQGVTARLGGTALTELVKEMSAGEEVSSLELKVTGEVKFRPVHAGRKRRVDATCPLRLHRPGTNATQAH